MSLDELPVLAQHAQHAQGCRDGRKVPKPEPSTCPSLTVLPVLTPAPAESTGWLLPAQQAWEGKGKKKNPAEAQLVQLQGFY